ncbi:MAG: tetratricopeptide repeat protein [Aestuariivirga sp.]
MYLAAAEKGNAPAAYHVGSFLEWGIGSSAPDREQAVAWYRRSAELGYAEGQLAYGNALSLGSGKSSNGADFIKWYLLAANQGNGVAQWELGVAYANGSGVPVDFAVALSWYLKAADNGLAAAQWAVGAAYADGLLGAERDTAKAYYWYALGAKGGDRGAEAGLRKMQRKLTSAQISEIESLISKWHYPKPPHTCPPPSNWWP